MSRRDVVDNKTLGESLLYFICSVATNTHVKHSAQESATRTAMTIVHSHLFKASVCDYEAAQCMHTAFSQLAKTNMTLTWESQEFLLACAMLCYEYFETISYLDSQEADALPF